MVHKSFKVTRIDVEFYKRFIENRLPKTFIDGHVHIALPEHTRGISPKLKKDDWALQCGTSMDEQQLQKYACGLFTGKEYKYVALPMPIKGVDLAANNQYIANLKSCGLMATMPDWDIEYCERIMLSGTFSGFKPYPNLVCVQKGAEISIFDFITHQQLALLNKHNKAVLIHLPRFGRLPDNNNIRELREIRNAYPKLKIVIAHLGRCYNFKLFLEGINKLGSDLGGYFFDTAAVLNPQIYAAAFDALSPDKIIFGTDMPILLWHGKRTWDNGTYKNLCREEFPWNTHVEGEEKEKKYTFFIYEQLNTMLNTIGKNDKVLQKVFYENAIEVYGMLA